MGNEVIKSVIISGAPENDIDYYKNYISDRFVLAADSGRIKCKKLNIVPDLIVGDFDSSSAPDTDEKVITLPVRKDDTDTFYAVKELIKKGCKDLLILGGIGSRVDHTYTNILALNFCADLGVKAVMINKNNRIRILNKSTVVKKDGYNYFSLFAFCESVYNLTTQGSEYNLDNFTLRTDNPLCQSNAFKDDEITINFKSGKILLVESND